MIDSDERRLKIKLNQILAISFSERLKKENFWNKENNVFDKLTFRLRRFVTKNKNQLGTKGKQFHKIKKNTVQTSGSARCTRLPNTYVDAKVYNQIVEENEYRKKYDD